MMTEITLPGINGTAPLEIEIAWVLVTSDSHW